jgi:hypothetical protein
MFRTLLEKMVRCLIQEEIDFIACDAVEGYNPSHDMCRYLIGAAVESVRRKTGRVIRNFDFALIEPPALCPEPLRDSAIWIHLNDADWRRKWVAACGYPEIAAEIETALADAGVDGFRTECLRPTENIAVALKEPPFYERFGEERCRQGIYHEVIRYRAHAEPMAEALWSHAIESDS